MYVSGASNAGTREGGSRLTRTTTRPVDSGQRHSESNEPMVHGSPTTNTSAGPTDHVFTFGGQTGRLPERMRDVGTWKAGVTQNVTWWKDSGQRFAITVR